MASRFLKTFSNPGLVAWIASVLSRALGQTLRFEVVDHCGVTREGNLETPTIWMFWHNRVFLMPFVRSQCVAGRHGAVLTSQSKDGEIIAQFVKRFGIDAVRGSSNKRPAGAFRDMLRVIRGGGDIAITPDGPRGPRYRLQAGAVKLAQLSQCPLLPIHLHYERAWTLKTWDGFLVPRPFTRARVTFGPLVSVGRDCSDDALEEIRLSLERSMAEDAELPWDTVVS